VGVVRIQLGVMDVKDINKHISLQAKAFVLE